MPELKFEDHSEEVQQILGQIPKWIIRWGITVLFIIVSIIFIGSRFIPYPEKINIPVSLTAKNAPAPIVVQQGSKRIAEWFKLDGELTKKGQLLAVWKTDDQYDDVLLLDQLFNNSDQVYPTIPDSLVLPTFKSSLREYSLNFSRYSYLIDSKEYLLEISKIRAEVIRKRKSLGLLNQQNFIKKREFSLLEKQFKQDSIYYYDGGYGITKRDYESELLQFLRQKSSFIQYQASLVDMDQSVRELENQILTIKQSRQSQINSIAENLEESEFALKQKIDAWKKQNILISPIDGILDRSNYWSENQIVNTGEVLALVIPEDQLQILCRSYVAPSIVGSLEIGQRVLLKMDGFNQQEYGSIEGEIVSVSNIPFNGQYIVKIELLNRLITNENKEIPLIQDLSGIGEVIISEGTLFERLVKLNL